MSPSPKVKKHLIKPDKRGWFTEILKTHDLKKPHFGQISLTVANAFEKKGSHYHKIRTEWFTVVTGKVNFYLKHMKTGKEKNIVLSSDKISTLQIPPFWYHELENKSKEKAIIVLYSDLAFDKGNPDTYRINA